MDNDEQTRCESDHHQIMAELKSIKDRMDADWKLIEASHQDLVGRLYMYSILKFIGFGGITWLIVHFSQ